MPDTKPLVIAHRGASIQLPENTLEAFRLAVSKECRADMLEFDVHLSRDGVPVIVHDPRLERTTNGRGYVVHKTWKDLQCLDAGYWFDPQKNRSFPWRGRGIRIPSLEEVLAEFSSVPLAVELKASSETLTRKAAHLIERFGLKNSVVLGSKHHRVSRVLRDDFPHLTRFCSQREVFRLLMEKRRGISLHVKLPNVIASVPRKILGVSFHRKDWVDFLHEKEMKAFFWTIDDEDSIRRLRDFGADGIITNDPRSVNRFLGRPA